jgi:hypothetical protein
MDMSVSLVIGARLRSGGSCFVGTTVLWSIGAEFGRRSETVFGCIWTCFEGTFTGQVVPRQHHCWRNTACYIQCRLRAFEPLLLRNSIRSFGPDLASLRLLVASLALVCVRSCLFLLSGWLFR